MLSFKDTALISS